jgi:hypothetical protein
MTDPTPDDSAQDDSAGLDEATIQEEALEAERSHVADRPPTEDEARRADALTPDPSVSEHAEEMNRIGADVKGEGEIS